MESFIVGYWNEVSDSLSIVHQYAMLTSYNLSRSTIERLSMMSNLSAMLIGQGGNNLLWFESVVSPWLKDISHTVCYFLLTNDSSSSTCIDKKHS